MEEIMLQMLLWAIMFIPKESRENMKGYNYSREDFIELLYLKYYKKMDYENYNWCLTLPLEFADERDFKAEDAIDLDYSIKLPESFSLGKWIYKTSNQGWLWSCTSMGTTHSVQILNVKKNWVEPTDKNIITPQWKDLWAKMWHSTTKYDGWDYVEKAVSTALKEWILIEENWQLARFDAYATDEWTHDDKAFDKMKRYLYKGCPIVWCVQWNATMWREMTTWEVKTIPEKVTWWHCIALVGWDKWWMWFINSWSANDWKGLKSRFYITYDVLKKLWWRLNYRYWVLYIEEDAKTDPWYLKMKNAAVLVLKALKKQYDDEPIQVKEAIVQLSKAYRETYPEINTELPL